MRLKFRFKTPLKILKSQRGDVYILISVAVSIVIFASVASYQFILNNKSRSNIRITENLDGFLTNELSAWHLYLKNKAELAAAITLGADATPTQNTSSTSMTGNQVGSTLIATGSTSEGASSITPPNQFCGSSASGNRLCLKKTVAAAAPVVVPIFPWEQMAYLKAPNPDLWDSFGGAVAIDGNTMVVAAPSEDSNQTTITNGTSASLDNNKANSGAVYVFKRTGNLWAQEAYLKPVNGDIDDVFGSSVAISGDTIVVGSPSEDSNQTSITNGSLASTNNSRIDSGAVYVYKRAGSVWSQQAYLKNSSVAYSNFGKAVAIDGNTIVATSKYSGSGTLMGAAFFYERTVNTWALTNIWDSRDAHYEFGISVSIRNGTAVIGSPDPNSGGRAFILSRDTNGAWLLVKILTASNAGEREYFGSSTAIDGDTIVVGAPYEGSPQNTITNGPTASTIKTIIRNAPAPGQSGPYIDLPAAYGAAYVYKRTGSQWIQEAYLKATNPDEYDNFGTTVAIKGNSIIVGSPGEDSDQVSISGGASANSNNSKMQSGAAYVFRRLGSTWAHEAYFKSSNADSDDAFGETVGFGTDTLIVGATNERSNQTTITNGPTASTDNTKAYSGAGYVFKLR